MDTTHTDSGEISEKERLILEAACKIFSEKGFSAATTNEIAKEAGVAEGTIFRYFRTKKDILRGLFLQIASLIAEKIALPSLEKILVDQTQKDAREVIREIVADRIKLVDTHFPMLKIIISEVFLHEDIKAIFIDKIVNKMIPMFEAFYLRKVEEGQFRPIKSHIVLRAFIGNIIILNVQKNIFGSKFPIDEMDEEIGAIIDILLFGISNHTN